METMVKPRIKIPTVVLKAIRMRFTADSDKGFSLRCGYRINGAEYWATAFIYQQWATLKMIRVVRDQCRASIAKRVLSKHTLYEVLNNDRMESYVES